jgi:membrane protein implicated in regulation of membrane protease activity
MPKTAISRLLTIGLFLTPPFVSAHMVIVPAVMPVAMPENWGLSDSIGFFALVIVLFAVLVRRRVLRPNKFPR